MGIFVKGTLSISISSNAMEATVCINSNGIQQITEEMIRQELSMRGIKAGIDEDVVRTLPYRARYGMEYVVAQGKVAEKLREASMWTGWWQSAVLTLSPWKMSSSPIPL